VGQACPPRDRNRPNSISAEGRSLGEPITMPKTNPTSNPDPPRGMEPPRPVGTPPRRNTERTQFQAPTHRNQTHYRVANEPNFQPRPAPRNGAARPLGTPPRRNTERTQFQAPTHRNQTCYHV